MQGALPVDAVLPELTAALKARANAVLVAPPGAGKTTRAPLALLDAPWRADGAILLLAPRRIAARAAAERLAQQLGQNVGDLVGFQVRFESRKSACTRIEVLTEGVFTRRILADPSLQGVACVLFDEIHERSLEGDLGLALALEAQEALRPDLRLVAMSATLDGARVGRLLDAGAPIVSEGRMHPIETVYRPRAAAGALEDDIARACMAALAGGSGDVLVFLPGQAEIARVERRLLDASLGAGVEIRPLHGGLDARAQDLAIAPCGPGRRKIVLSTSIAETSLTIEGVRIVIDSGLARRPKYEPDTGLTKLVTLKASQASVDQRRGRAGRTAPGTCIRLWSEGETRALPPYDRPEILEADLAGLALDLAAWGARDPFALRWLDPPPAPAWREAVSHLKDLGALDGEGALTAMGRKLTRLPLEPRLARMVLEAGKTGQALEAAQIAAVLSETSLTGRDLDLEIRLETFNARRTPRGRTALQQAERWARLVEEPAAPGAKPLSIGALASLAYPDRVAQRRAQDRRGAYLLANGRGAQVPEDHSLAGEKYIVAVEVTGAAGQGRILCAAVLSEADLFQAHSANVSLREGAVFDAERLSVRAVREERLGGLVLRSSPLEKPDPASLSAALMGGVRALGLAILPWGPSSRQLQARLAFARSLDTEGWPNLSDTALMEQLDAWLTDALWGKGRIGDLSAGELCDALWTLIGPHRRRDLDLLAPAEFETPLGSRIAIDYSDPAAPAVEIRIQEVYGVKTHPAIAGGRIPLTLKLLSPARRPIQTTSDLPRFWAGSYAEVRGQMRARYPKHVWPDDPANAAATMRAKPKNG